MIQYDMRASHRGNRLPISSIRSLIPLADAAKKRGITVHHLNLGQPDVASPRELIDSIAAWRGDYISYVPSRGTPAYLQALSSYYHTLGHTYIAPDDIVGTIAGSEAIMIALFSCADPGDEFLVFEPFYPSYATMATMWGVKLVGCKTSIAHGFHLPTQEEVERHITKKTRGIIYSSPANPTGVVYTNKEVMMLKDLVIKHNLFLIADEVYREYHFSDTKHTSILDILPEIPDHAILVDSLSKRYNLCGARLGALVTKNKEIRAVAEKYVTSRLSGSLLDQWIASHILQVPDAYIRSIQTTYRRRRDLLYSLLKTIPGVTVGLPEGAFYLMAQLPVADADHFARYLLTDFEDRGETVMIAPGYGFYLHPEDGKHMVRMAYVLQEQHLKRSAQLLRLGLARYAAHLR